MPDFNLTTSSQAVASAGVDTTFVAKGPGVVTLTNTAIDGRQINRRLWPGSVERFRPVSAVSAVADTTALLTVTQVVPDLAGLPGTGTVAFEDLAPDVAVGLGGTFAPFAASGNLIVAVGDSITANYGNGTSYRQPDGYLTQACMLAKQAVRFYGTYATAGYTLAQIRDTHIPAVLALNPLPSACVILGGTNDVGANGGTGFVAAPAIAIVAQMVASLRAKSIRPILATIPPRGDNTTVNAAVDKYNRALRSYAGLNGLDLVDFHRVLVDQYTGVWKTGLGQNDGGIHPNFAGVLVMAAELAAILTARWPATRAPIAQHVADAGNLINAGAGLFGADSNADGVANSWSNFSGGTNLTFTTPTDADGVTKWQRITLGATTTGGSLLQWAANSLCAAGDVIEFCCRVQASGFSAAFIVPTGANGGTGPSWSVSVSVTGDAAGGPDIAYTLHGDLADGVLYGRYVVGAGATGQLKVNLQTAGAPASGTAYMQVANCALRNLTQLGLAA